MTDLLCCAALCCAVWEVYCGKQAWQGLHYGVVVERVVISKERPPVPEDMPQELELLMRRCWDDDPMQRPSFRQVRWWRWGLAVLGAGSVGKEWRVVVLLGDACGAAMSRC